MKSVERLREVCRSFPEATEDHGVGDPVFKVIGKISAMQHERYARPSMWCKAPSGVQDALVASDLSRFFVPPCVGRHGWVGPYLGADTDWEEIAELIEESYRMTAPRSLSRLFDAPAD